MALVVPAQAIDAGLPDAGRWLGERFDTVGLLGMAWVVFRRFFHLSPGRNPFRSPRALFCSESVVRTLKAARYPGAEGLGDEDETPGDVLEFLRRSGAEVIDARTLNLVPRRTQRRRAPPPQTGAEAGRREAWKTGVVPRSRSGLTAGSAHPPAIAGTGSPGPRAPRR